MRRHVLGLGTAAALMLAGCGGDSPSLPRGGATMSPPASPIPTVAPSSPAPVTQGTDTTAPDLVVATTRGAFEPATVVAKAGTVYDLRADNSSALEHTFTVFEMKIDVPLPRRVLTFAKLPPMKAGSYRMICTTHANMEGVLRVTP